MKANKISVIVPVFNVENYLEKCVKSIIEQTYKNLEVILVDDGSTDKSGFLCDELKKQDYRIKVIHKTNGGLSDARNAGIQVSTGKYLSFIDSDDYLERTALEQMMQAILISHSEIAICNIMRFYDDGCTEEFYNPTDNQEVLEGIRRFDTLNQPSVCNKLFDAKLFANISFPYGKFYEDTYVYHELLYKADKVVLTGKTGYWYLSRKGSILGRSQFSNRYFDFISNSFVAIVIKSLVTSKSIASNIFIYARYCFVISIIEISFISIFCLDIISQSKSKGPSYTFKCMLYFI